MELWADWLNLQSNTVESWLYATLSVGLRLSRVCARAQRPDTHLSNTSKCLS